MNKVTSFEIHLSVDANGIPVDGYVEYTLTGSAAVITTNVMSVTNLTAFAEILDGGNTYFEVATSQFIKKS